MLALLLCTYLAKPYEWQEVLHIVTRRRFCCSYSDYGELHALPPSLPPFMCSCVCIWKGHIPHHKCGHQHGSPVDVQRQTNDLSRQPKVVQYCHSMHVWRNDIMQPVTTCGSGVMESGRGKKESRW